MKPYFDDGQIVIYHGDCREVAPLLGRFDLLLTDPPYGIHACGGKWGRKSDLTWDKAPIEHVFLMSLVAITKYQIVWGGNYYVLAQSRCWLVWHKPDAVPSAGDIELAWTNFDKPAQQITHSIAATNGERVGHPTQKPEAVMRWALMQAPSDVMTVLDPFMGSGTTLVAAKRLGRKAVGIELEERWCEVAAKRLRQGVLPLAGPVTPQPSQARFDLASTEEAPA